VATAQGPLGEVALNHTAVLDGVPGASLTLMIGVAELATYCRGVPSIGLNLRRPVNSRIRHLGGLGVYLGGCGTLFATKASRACAVPERWL